MGSAAGIKFHLGATHRLPEDAIAGMITMQRERYGITSEMMAVARIHQALHAADKLLAETQTDDGSPVLCTECGERTAVVILTTAKLCRPCALIAGERIGREN